MTPGIIELNLHGMNVHQAKAHIDHALRSAPNGTYRIRVVHGFQRGTILRDMVRETYRNHEKVIRMEIGFNPGQTELVIREY